MQPVSRGRRIAIALLLINVAALVVVAIMFRLWRLGSMPGVNADEAWFGVQALELLAGRSVQWRTPSGNLLPQLFFWPTVALHALFEPSFALLRTVAVVSGLLALVVNFVLCLRAFGRPVAIVSSVLLAILPVNIAYSRFGWETSQTLLFATLTFYSALLAVREDEGRFRWSVTSVFALLASLLVHPTNIFLAPMVALALSYAWREPLRSHLDPRVAVRGWRWKWLAIVVLTLLGTFVARAWVATALENASQPTEWAAFVRNLGRLFSGTTVYQFISGGANVASTGLQWHAMDVLFWACAAAAVFGLARLFRREDDVVVRCLAWGWLASVLAFFLIGGASAIAPHHERYGLWMIGPTAVLLSVGITRWITRAHSRRVAPWVWSAAAWLLLLGFHTEYFERFIVTGGTSHYAFRTGIVDPKQQAYEHVLREAADQASDTGEHALLVTSEWWSYWPLRYLAGDGVQVVRWGDYLTEQANMTNGLRKNAWFVEFADSDGLIAVRSHLAVRKIEIHTTPILDYAGRHAMVVLTTQRCNNATSTDAKKLLIFRRNPHGQKLTLGSPDIGLQ